MIKKANRFLHISYIILFALSLTQVFYTYCNKDSYFYNIYPIIPSILLIYLTNSTSLKKKGTISEVSECLLKVMYLLAFQLIYIFHCPDIYLIIFLCVKEVIIAFIIFATRYLYCTLNKNREDFQFKKFGQIAIDFITFFIILSLLIDKVVTFKLGLYIYIASFIILIMKSILSWGITENQILDNANNIV